MFATLRLRVRRSAGSILVRRSAGSVLDRRSAGSILVRRPAVGAALVLALTPLLVSCASPLAGPGRGIHVVGADGAGLIRVADGTPSLAWSPDGERLALLEPDGTIAVVPADGSGERRPPTGEPFIGPGWSPAGDRVASIDNAADVVRIWSADGAPVATAPLLDPLPPDWMVAYPVDNVPAWSPDGRRLAFVAWDGNGDELYSITADGAQRQKLSTTPASRNPVDSYPSRGQRVARADVGAPAWSPDGRAVAFALYPEVRGATGGITLVTADGLRQSRITSLLPVGGPVWSPDGRWLAFTARQGAVTDLYLVTAAGTRLTNLTRTYPGRVRDPAWSPDGRQLAFSGDGDIWVMSAGGTGRRRVADSGLIDLAPRWSPDGDKIAFRSEPPQPGT